MPADDAIPYVIEIEGPARVRVRAQDEDSRMVKQASAAGWLDIRRGGVLTIHETVQGPDGRTHRHNVIQIRGT